MQGLVAGGGSFFSEAWGVSADGGVVVGYGYSSSGREAFIWDTTNGMRSLKNVLEVDYGLDLSGWRLDGRLACRTMVARLSGEV